jgi:hypothetical protein
LQENHRKGELTRLAMVAGGVADRAQAGRSAPGFLETAKEILAESSLPVMLMWDKKTGKSFENVESQRTSLTVTAATG